MSYSFRPMQTLQLTLFCLFAFPLFVNAQFLQVTDVVSGPYNPTNLISNVFLGDGVQVTNVQFNGDPRAVGYFSGGTPSVGIDRGILLTTGFAVSATKNGALQATDLNAGGSVEPSLKAQLPLPPPVLNDVAVYTITFIPNADTIRFRYAFASEEYPEYACSQFNDVFGFFIQGPGYPAFTNIARIPGTGTPGLPVTINNLHPANSNYPNCPNLNVQYYNNNVNSNNQPVYDGFTDVFTAMAVVIPCQPYTIKLAIADVGDTAYDSGVFLEAKSFGTGSLQVNAISPSADGTLAEGCTAGAFTFTLPNAHTTNYSVVYNVFGTAVEGQDFQLLPSTLTIPAGQSTITVPVVALEDNIAEGLESIGISVQVDPCKKDTVYLYIRDRILQAPVLADSSVCLPNTPIQLNATVPTPVPAPPTFTNTTDYLIPDNGGPINSTLNVVGVLPVVIGPGVIRSVCFNIDHKWIDDIDAYLISPTGTVLELTTDNGGDGDNYTNTCFTPTANKVISFPGPFAPASAAPFTGDWLPEGPWSDLYGEPSNGNWRLRITDDQNGFIGKLLDWTMTFEPTYDVTYAWSPATGLNCADCPNPIATIPTSTIYNVTATDSYGCTVTENVELTIGSLTASAMVTQPIKCFGEKGTIQANAAGNNTYIWSNGQTTATISNLGPGTYTVTITSMGANCSDTIAVNLLEPAELFATPSANDVTCFGLSTGTAAIYPSGGVQPYTYQWSNGLQLDSISNLLPGTYSVTVTDANGCQESTSMKVAEPTTIQLLTALKKSPSCFGLSDGQLTTYAVGGTTPFVFVWNTGQVNQGITNIAAGTYTVTATDGNGCSQVKTEVVTEPVLLTSFATPVDVKCFSKNTGTLHIDAMGGTPTYSAAWTGPNGYVGNGLTINNLFAGSYQVTVTDAHGCTSILSPTIGQPTQLQLSLPAISDTICFGSNNGTATALMTGGAAPYSYKWDANAQTSQTATGLASNQYHVTITDFNGCTTTGLTFVQQQQQLNTFAQAQPPGCHDGLDGTGSVISIFYGATPANLGNFSYFWNTSPPKSGQNVSGLQGGRTYVVTATDALGCTATASVPVSNPQPLQTAITGFSDAKCFGDATGTASAKGIGGTLPYTWQWNSGTNPQDSLVQGLMAGTYRVTITDHNGCPGSSSVTIGQPTQLRVSFSHTDVKCFGGADGLAKALPAGGTPPYQYIWASGSSSASVQNLAAGTYLMSVMDGHGCTTPANVVVDQPSEALGGTATMQEPHCFGGYDGRITLTPTGGTPSYRYAIDNKPFNGSSIQIGIPAGNYTPKIIDKNGCEYILAPIQVTQPAPILVDLGPDISIQFGRDTQLLATVQNALGLTQYAWSAEDSIWLSCLDCRNPSVYSLQSPTYFEVVVTDTAGCRAQDQILVSVIRQRKVFVPTGFSPNGDFTNDLLLVHGQSNSKALDFKVYDRWGEMVFQLQNFAFNDDSMGWDGSFRGQPCDPGVYVWVLEVEYVDGVKEVFKGNTTLIR